MLVENLTAAENMSASIQPAILAFEGFSSNSCAYCPLSALARPLRIVMRQHCVEADYAQTRETSDALLFLPVCPLSKRGKQARA